MFSFFRRKKEVPPLPVVDFDQLVATLSSMSKSAQMTFLYRYVQTLSPNMVKSLIRYSYARMDDIKNNSDGTIDQLGASGSRVATGNPKLNPDYLREHPLTTDDAFRGTGLH